MPAGPSLVFDKSSLESLNIHEAALMDNFYMSTITPLFFVECLADLERQLRSGSTPEQLVGSLADRTPDAQGHPNIHHMQILNGELSREFDLNTVYERPAMSHGQNVQLGEKKGVVFRKSQEQEALERWTRREFLEVERNMAKAWRRMLTAVNFNAMVHHVMKNIGPWRKPKSLQDAKQMTDAIIDNLDPEWLLRFGIELLDVPSYVGVPRAGDIVVEDWIQRRRPPLREYVPYFIFMLTINLFFCLLLPTQLLKNVKASHQIDLAYLYYLPFCSVFTSKDNFHAEIVPLFLNPRQTFVNGNDFKEEFKKLDAHYSALPEDVLRTGLINFAATPPDDTSFLTTRLWDKYLPAWREIKAKPKAPRDAEADKRLIEELNAMTDSPALKSHDETDMEKLSYMTVVKDVKIRKGKWQRFSDEQEQRMRDEGLLP